MTPSAPTTEIGSASLGFTLPTWDTMSPAIDEREYAPDLIWPRSIDTYRRMETDAQINGLMLGTMLPIRRFRWSVDPNGASDQVAEHIARDFNLPITGEDSAPMVPRSEQRNRFSHDRHLAHALRALVYGHYPFEQVGQIGSDDLFHLRKLAPRPPYTLAQGGSIEVARDGGLAGIKQGIGLQSKLIPIDRLVYYCWDQEGSDWFGRSMIRSCFRHWARKDRLLRVDAMKHERNSMGVPWFETGPELSQGQVDKLAATAQKFRSGDKAGGAGPGKLQIKGVDGQLPDIIESIRYDDQQMTMATLMLFVDLGRNAETGSRALGSEFIDWYGYAQEAIADWYAGVTTEHAIWDVVDWNYGPDENAPKLVYDRSAEEDLPTADLATLVERGIVQVDSGIEAVVRQRFKLPPKPEEIEQTPTGQSFAYDLDNGIISIDERRAQIGLAPREDGLGSLTVPEYLAQYAGTAEDAIQGGGPTARQTVRAGKTSPPASAADITVGHRQPTDQEARAATDFEAMQADFQSERDVLVSEVRAAQAEQITELEAQVSDADGDLENLAAIAATPVAAATIATTAKQAARRGVSQVTAEAGAQGVEATAPALTELDAALESRAAAIDQALADALSQAAKSKALQLSGSILTPEQVATQVRLHLENLSTAYLEEQLGGLVNQAQNTGRKETMRANPPTTILASELLDTNTCSACAERDGTEYASVDEAEADYPTGGYFACEGGLRCRGTVVALWG